MSESDRSRWDERYATGSYKPASSPDWLSDLESEFTAAGRALDVAAGTGRVAIWLAKRGYSVTAVDISEVGLGVAADEARGAGLRIATLAIDLERDELPPGPFAAVACFRYLQRDLFPEMRSRLVPGGLLVCEIATRRNLERNPRPGAHRLLEMNELLRLCAPLEIVFYREGWFEGQFLARALARSPSSAGSRP